jgi:hypothetical protein
MPAKSSSELWKELMNFNKNMTRIDNKEFMDKVDEWFKTLTKEVASKPIRKFNENSIQDKQ